MLKSNFSFLLFIMSSEQRSCFRFDLFLSLPRRDYRPANQSRKYRQQNPKKLYTVFLCSQITLSPPQSFSIRPSFNQNHRPAETATSKYPQARDIAPTRRYFQVALSRRAQEPKRQRKAEKRQNKL